MPKIAIISDSHDNIPRIDQMLTKIKKENIKTIIHCGDVCTRDTLRYLYQNFDGQIYLSMGNIDVDHEIKEKINNVKIFPKFGEVKIDNINIAFTHYSDKAKGLTETKKYDYIFYGHTHKPWEENLDNCKIINPGTLAGAWSKSTFAILDTKTRKLELIIL